MKILGIETSCDDTGISVLEVKESLPAQAGKKGTSPEFCILSNVVSSQIKVHKKYGGVYPAIAKREHQENILPTFIEALKTAEMLGNPKSQFSNPKQIPITKIQNEKIKTIRTILEREPELEKKLILFLKKYQKPDINLIAVTNGPGLEPCLWVGINFARALSYFWDIPVVPVNHIEGHILVNFLLLPGVIPAQAGIQLNDSANINVMDSRLRGNDTAIKFPAVALVVSGGHTQIILMQNIGDYKILGETRDDAAGECFDKAAKILGLDYPGGPIISKLADRHPMSIQTLYRHRVSIRLPRPMINTKDYDFSFSGLKTAILYKVKEDCGYAPLRSAFGRTVEGRQYIKQMCGEIQQAIIDVLIKKTLKAAKDFNAKTIILGGGVSANSELKKQFQNAVSSLCHSRESGNPAGLILPPANLSIDNGLMIAIAGYFNKNKKMDWQKLQADSNLRIAE